MKRVAIVLAALIFSLPTIAGAAAVVFEDSGASPADILATVNAFRTFLGDNNGVGGSFLDGRREINWDGVPDAFAAPHNLPVNFFNNNSLRGVVFFTPGTGFQVSADDSNPTGTHTPATVDGFAAVFTDVNTDDSTKIEYFDVNGALLVSRDVLPGPTSRGSLSFLGVGFDAGEPQALP